jgi:hypothetical protein
MSNGGRVDYHRHCEYRLIIAHGRTRIYTYSLCVQLSWGWDISRRYTYVFL